MKNFVRENLNEYANYLQGGKGDNISEKDVNPNQLKIGIAVEMEHTDNPDISKEIALDHLAEHDNYYTILIEAGLVDESIAIQLYNDLYSEDTIIW